MNGTAQELGQTISPERIKVSKLLYKFAWVIEILAVTIGLSIAFMQMFTSFDEMTSEGESLGGAGVLNIVIAGLPFVMVAVVELTKIPFTEAFYKTSRLLWKWTFGLSLLFIAFITFESAINGFERNFNAMTYGIDKYKKELTAVDEEIPKLVSRREEVDSLTADAIEEDFNERQKVLSEEKDAQVSAIQQRISTLRSSVKTESADLKRKQIQEKKSQIQDLLNERNSELKVQAELAKSQLDGADAEISINRRNLQNQLAIEQSRLTTTETNGKREIEDASIFSERATRERVESEIESQRNKVEMLRQQLNGLNALELQNQIRAENQEATKRIRETYQSQITSIEEQVEMLTRELNQMIGSREKDIEQLISNHQTEIVAVEKQYASQQQENEQYRKEQYEALQNNKSISSQLTDEIETLRSLRLELRNTINIKVGDNQIFRMAQWAYDKDSAADLSRDEVSTIAAIWFGSLATLIAFTGIMLALASFVIGDPSLPNKGEKKNSSATARAFNSFRRYLIYRRRLNRQPIIKEIPKEVIQEVPVTKVQLTEKPVEIIKREIVHVPMYTNDPELLKRNPDVDL